MGRKRGSTSTRFVGPYRLAKKIDAGGNGEVWTVASPPQSTVVKILTRSGREASARFKREVQILRLISRPGVMPVLESNVDTDETPLWFLMPHAVPLVEAVGGGDRDTCLAALADLASVFADLADEAVHHRDIKPANLFQLNGQATIGDFGLVTSPLDEGGLTVGRNKLGSMHYIAPEMLNHPDAAAAGPADVYSFAKTIWVLMSGLPFPLPGRHEDSSSSLRLLCPETPNAARLDVLLGQMTHLDPASRPSMRTVASELHSWGRSIEDADLGSPERLREIIQSALAHHEVAAGEVEKHFQMRAQVTASVEQLLAALGPIPAALIHAGAPLFMERGSDPFQTDASDLLATAVLPPMPTFGLPNPRDVRDARAALVQGVPGMPSLRLWGGVVLGDAPEATYVVGAAVHSSNGRLEPLWHSTRTAILGGPSEAAISYELLAEMSQRLATDLEHWRRASADS